MKRDKTPVRGEPADLELISPNVSPEADNRPRSPCAVDDDEPDASSSLVDVEKEVAALNHTGRSFLPSDPGEPRPASALTAAFDLSRPPSAVDRSGAVSAATVALAEDDDDEFYSPVLGGSWELQLEKIRAEQALAAQLDAEFDSDDDDDLEKYHDPIQRLLPEEMGATPGAKKLLGSAPKNNGELFVLIDKINPGNLTHPAHRAAVTQTKHNLLNIIRNIYYLVIDRGNLGQADSANFHLHIAGTAYAEYLTSTKIQGKDHIDKARNISNQIKNAKQQIQQMLNIINAEYTISDPFVRNIDTILVYLAAHQNILEQVLLNIENKDSSALITTGLSPNRKRRVSAMHETDPVGDMLPSEAVRQLSPLKRAIISRMSAQGAGSSSAASGSANSLVDAGLSFFQSRMRRLGGSPPFVLNVAGGQRSATAHAHSPYTRSVPFVFRNEPESPEAGPKKPDAGLEGTADAVQTSQQAHNISISAFVPPVTKRTKLG